MKKTIFSEKFSSEFEKILGEDRNFWYEPIRVTGTSDDDWESEHCEPSEANMWAVYSRTEGTEDWDEIMTVATEEKARAIVKKLQELAEIMNG